MELTEELLIAALYALMDQSITRAASLRLLAADSVGDAREGRLHAANLHSKRLADAAELAEGIRHNGLDNVALVK